MVMLVVIVVEVRMGVDERAMPMGVFVDKIDTQEEVRVLEDFAAGAFGNEGMGFAKDVGTRRNLWDDTQVVGGGDEGFPGLMERHEEFDEPALRARV